MGKMKELFIKERNEAQQVAVDNVVEQIVEAVEKLTTAATDQSELLKLITDEILTLKSKVKELENKHTHA